MSHLPAITEVVVTDMAVRLVSVIAIQMVMRGVAAGGPNPPDPPGDDGDGDEDE